MQSRARAGDGQNTGSHPAVVELKNAEARHPASEPPLEAGRAGWLSSLFGRSKGATAARHSADANPLLAFSSETPTAAARSHSDPGMRPFPVAPARRPGANGSLLVFGGLVLLGSLGALGANRLNLITIPSFAQRDARLTIDTRPSGASVTIDGEARGSSPVTVTLKPGSHTMTIKSAADERVVPLTLAPGAELTQYFELRTIEPVAVVGRVSVITDPAGARVSVDGKAVGAAPITALELPVGQHRISVTSETGSAERTITLEADATASVVFSLPRVVAPLGGWLSVSAPFDIQILEDGEVIGSGGAARIMLAGGRHDLVLVNRALEFSEPRRVEIAPGRTVAVRVDAPKAMVSANARPWADVLIDGTSVGQTPIANLAVPIGTHQVVFRHPQLGERRETLVVGTRGPNRISVDLTRSPSQNQP